MTLFCDVTLAERIERAEAELIAAATRHRAGFVLPVAGGVATFAEPGSPLNKVAGLGFGRVPDLNAGLTAGLNADLAADLAAGLNADLAAGLNADLAAGLNAADLNADLAGGLNAGLASGLNADLAAGLAAVERAFAARGCPVQVEVASLADPAVGEMLTGRGYRLVGFEDVLGRTPGFNGTAPPGVEVRRARADEFEAWLDLVADAVAEPDTQGVPSHEEFPRDVVVNAMRDMAAAGVRQYLALRDGVPAGGASMRISAGVAQLTGAATLPAHRRHGVQTALLAARLADAAAAGCDIAVVTTQPGSKSQQNVQRQGFALLYTRAVLVKPS